MTNCIDIHTHAFPDHIAPRAMKVIAAKANMQPAGDGTISDLLRGMDAAGVERSTVFPIATKPGQVEGILKWLAAVKIDHGDRIVPFASIHPEDDTPADWLRRIREAGMKGIKLHPMYQDFLVDEDAMISLFNAAANENLLVAMHCGRDVGFPNDPIPDRASPIRLAKLIDILPNLRLLCTHMGGWKMWDDVENHLAAKNVYFETSLTSTFSPPEQIVRLIRKHGSEMVCFGTDWPWGNIQTEKEFIETLDLSEEELHNVMYKTASKLLE